MWRTVRIHILLWLLLVAVGPTEVRADTRGAGAASAKRAEKKRSVQPAGVHGPSKEANNPFLNGEEAFQQGRYEEARAFFQEALQQPSEPVRPLWGLARSEEKLGRCDEAIQHGSLFMDRSGIKPDDDARVVAGKNRERIEIKDLMDRCRERQLAAAREAEEKRLQAAREAEAAAIKVTPPTPEPPKPQVLPVEPPPPPVAPKPSSEHGLGQRLWIAGIVLFATGATAALGGGGLQQLSSPAGIIAGSLGGGLAIGGAALFVVGECKKYAMPTTSWILAPTLATGGAGIAAAGTF